MKKSYRSRQHLTVGLVLPLVAVAVASVMPGDAGGSSNEARTPHRGGTLTMVVGTNPTSLVYDTSGGVASDETITSLYADRLFNFNAKQELIPSLATSYHLSKNALTYTVFLRHGVKWSDGVPFTSKDVVFTLTKVLPLDPTITATLAKDITSVKASGTYEVVIQLKQPFAPLLIGMTGGTLYVLPQHLYGNQTVLKDTAANNHPVGTGPFMIKQWIPDQKVVLVRNPHFFGATKNKPLPWFNEIVVDIVTSPQTITDDLLSGAVDYVQTSFLPTTSIKQLRGSSCCRVVQVHTTPGYNVLNMNTTRAPFKNLAVRRAVLMAITRKTIVKDAVTGYGTPGLAAIPSTYAQLYTPKVNLMKQYPYNPSKAAKMLDQAGFRVKNGERFGKAITLLYSPSTGAFTQEEAAIIKANLAKITVKVKLVSADVQTFLTELYTKKNYTLSFINETSESDPAIGIVPTFACQPAPTATYTNATGFCTKQLTSLFHQAVVAPTTSARQHAYARAQRIIDSKVPAYMLYWRDTFVAISKRIQNWKPSLSGGGTFNTTWSQSWFK